MWTPEDSFPYFQVAKRHPEFGYADVLRVVEQFERDPLMFKCWLNERNNGSYLNEIAIAFDREQRRRRGAA